jgi:hypothetical protein
MITVWGENVDQWPREFLRQIPARVLIRCLESLILPRSGKSNKRPLCLIDDVETPASPNKKLQRTRREAEMDSCNLESLLMVARKKDMWSIKIDPGIMDAKLAAKNDDAQAPIDEWNKRALRLTDDDYEETLCSKACDLLRKVLLRRFRHFKSGVIRSFRKYMCNKYGNEWMELMRAEAKKRRGRKEIERDYDVGMDAIHRASRASFWDWDDGSTLFFWRWPKELHESLRDGMPVWFRKQDLPSYWGRQRWPMKDVERSQLREKIGKVLNRRYVSSGFVSSLTGFFAVPKGTEDIRVVYDATKSGLNDAIWAPNFFLPTIDSVVNQASEETVFGDIDIGEMFLNYFLDSRLRARAGVDVTELAPDWNIKLKEGQRWILRWERSLMGVKSSPYNCVRIYLLGEEIIRGDRRAASNPMRWDCVKLNLPGTESYDPSRPWMYRYDSVACRLAAFLVSYVDDLRTGSQGSQEEGDKLVHYVASKLNYLGQQDASRKRGFASCRPGAWAGAVVESDQDTGLYVTITQKKWDKVKTIIERYVNILQEDKATRGEVMINRKVLEQDVGFLVHVFMTYENLRPFLKGFYLTLNGWRFDRNEEGWKLDKADWEDLAIDLMGESDQWEVIKNECKAKQHGVLSTDGPPMVRMVDRMKRDLEVLESTFAATTPSRRLVRGKGIARILYGFGDASGAGFGASWSKPLPAGAHTDIMRYRFGRWGKDEESSSSNYRELKNLVDTLNEMGRADELTGVEVFLFTDNSTAEAAFARGSSSNRKLFELIKHVKLLEMTRHTRIHIIHVAGKRMIVQGTDGLSRGVLSEGVMGGDDMSAFIPLHKNALERSEGLLTWLQSNCDEVDGNSFVALTVEDWFERGHDVIGGERNVDGIWVPRTATGSYVWAPPPCVAVQCLEELRRARHKRQNSAHIFVCPRIMSSVWQRHLYKSADVVIHIPPGHPVWNSHQYEPLVIGLFFPFLQHEPWQLKRAPRILEMGRQLQSVCKADPLSSGRLLRQLWNFTRQLPKMQEHVVLRVLQGTGDFKIPQTVARE